MYKGISAPFIHRPIATTLLMVAVFLVGLVAFPSLPVAPLPQVDFPTIAVSASLPGASPDTMATSVAQPLERQIAQIPGVSQMTSTSALGATAITVQFDLNRNIDAAANDIQAAINAAAGQLPKDLPSPPTYRKVNPSDTPILILSVALGRGAHHRRRRRGRERSRAAPQPDLGRLPRARRRPADAGHTDPDRSSEARRKGHAARGRAGADRHCDRGQPERRAHRAEADLHDSGQRPADRSQGLERRHRRLSQRGAGPSARHRPGDRGTAGHDTGRLEQRQAQRLSRRVQDPRRERHHDRARRSRARSPPCRLRSRRPFTSAFSPIARPPSALRSATSSSPSRSPSPSW